jgi:glycine cleavage system H protein
MKYTESHEWVTLQGNIATVGVSQHAQKELGDIVYVELPKVGKKIQANEEAAVLESTKAAADVYSPVSGTITEVNTALNDHSELVNQSPENEGWLFKVQITNPSEIDNLMNHEAYNAKFSS